MNSGDIHTGIATSTGNTTAAGGTSNRVRIVAKSILIMGAITPPSGTETTPSLVDQPFRVIAGLLHRFKLPYAAAMPITFQSLTCGVVVTASSRPYVLDGDQYRLITPLTNMVALRAVLSARLANNAVTIGQLRQALRSRIAIEQAKGILAERHRISIDTAFSCIRNLARASNRTVNDIAHAIVDGGLDISDIPPLGDIA